MTTTINGREIVHISLNSFPVNQNNSAEIIKITDFNDPLWWRNLTVKEAKELLTIVGNTQNSQYVERIRYQMNTLT
jgi:hypothetical protein